MTAYFFPLRAALTQDAGTVMRALDGRSAQIKSNIDSQSLFRKGTVLAVKSLGITSGVGAIASVPTAISLLSIAPLTIGAASLCTAMTCLAVHIFLSPRSDAEQIVKNKWKAVFEALRKGDGQQILDSGTDLAKQEKERPSAFKQCIGSLSPQEITPFLHKVRVIGFLQIAMGHLRQGEERLAKENAYYALANFDDSGFPKEIESFIRWMIDTPKGIRQLMGAHQAGNDLHALDYLMAVKISADYSAAKGGEANG